MSKIGMIVSTVIVCTSFTTTTHPWPLDHQEVTPHAIPSQNSQEVYAVINGANIAASRVDALAGAKLVRIQSQEYDIKRAIVNSLIAEMLLEQEATRRRITVTDLTRLEIDNKAHPVTDEEVRVVYLSAKEQFTNIPETDAMKRIQENMQRERANQRRAEFVKELRSHSEVRMILQPPRIEVAPGDNPSLGPNGAPVTIVAFSEFQCPYCGRVVPVLKRLEKQYGQNIRVVFRDFPLETIHRDAAKAAEAASCADEQGKFWQMHDKLFANQRNLQVLDLKKYAAELGLKQGQFDVCLESGKYRPKWVQNRDEGMRYGVSGTPTFFINGRLLSGAVGFEAFSQIIDEELEIVKASGTSAGRGARR